MELKVVNMAGKQTGTIKLSDELFNREYNDSLIQPQEEKDNSLFNYLDDPDTLIKMLKKSREK